MKFLKQLILAILIISIPCAALAAPSGSNNDVMNLDYMNEAPGSDFNIIGFVKTLINWFFYALLVVALFMLIWVGYTYVTASGDTKKTSKAAGNLGYILMGIAIALIAKGLIYAACYLVTSSGTVCTFW